MTITTTLHESDNIEIDNLGIQLAMIRQQRGYTVEYVAGQLNLRMQIIDFIERSEFHLLPGPVFVKGYLRAYSKLLGVAPEPYLAIFDKLNIFEQKPERTLWQSKRETHKAEHVIRWVTIVFAVCVLIAVGVWWQKNRDSQHSFAVNETPADLSLNQPDSEVKLADISKMQSILTPKPEMSPVEKEGG